MVIFIFKLLIRLFKCASDNKFFLIVRNFVILAIYHPFTPINFHLDLFQLSKVSFYSHKTKNKKK